MQQTRKTTGILVFTFIIGALRMGSAGILAATTSGRNFSRCIQTCNATRKACADNCQTDCRDLYPNDKQLRDACVSACKSICSDESDQCKDVCQGIKPPPTEE